MIPFLVFRSMGSVSVHPSYKFGAHFEEKHRVFSNILLIINRVY